MLGLLTALPGNLLREAQEATRGACTLPVVIRVAGATVLMKARGKVGWLADTLADGGRLQGHDWQADSAEGLGSVRPAPDWQDPTASCARGSGTRVSANRLPASCAGSAGTWRSTSGSNRSIRLLGLRDRGAG